MKEAFDAIVTFTAPTAADILAATNFYIATCEQDAIKEENFRLKQIADEAARIERIRLAAEHAALQAEWLAKREREKEEKARQKALKAQADLMKRLAAKPLPEIGRNSQVHSHAGEGLTHRSVCHPSRETLHLGIREYSSRFATICGFTYYPNHVSM
jgi:hypothetical protein